MHGCASQSHTTDTLSSSAALKGRRLGYLLIQLIIESAAPEGRNPLRQCQL
jgi:hypothetical protein